MRPFKQNQGVDLDRIERDDFLESCFPKAERFINRHPKLIAGFQELEEVRRYRSVLDYVLATFAPTELSGIEEFYAGRGPPMKSLHAPATLRAYDEFIERALNAVHEIYMQFLRVEWSKNRDGNVRMFRLALSLARNAQAQDSVGERVM